MYKSFFKSVTYCSYSHLIVKQLTGLNLITTESKTKFLPKETLWEQQKLFLSHNKMWHKAEEWGTVSLYFWKISNFRTEKKDTKLISGETNQKFAVRLRLRENRHSEMVAEVRSKLERHRIYFGGRMDRMTLFQSWIAGTYEWQ